MIQIEVSILCFCLALLGMTTLLLTGARKYLSMRETTLLLLGTIGYFLIVLSWDYYRPLALVLITIPMLMTVSAFFEALKAKKFNPVWVLNWIANVALFALAFKH